MTYHITEVYENLHAWYRALSDSVINPVQINAQDKTPAQEQIILRIKQWPRSMEKILNDHTVLCDALMTLEECAGRNNPEAFKKQTWHFLSACETLIEDISAARRRKATFYHYPSASLAKNCHGYRFNPNRTRAGINKELFALDLRTELLADTDLRIGPISPEHYTGDDLLILAGKDKSYLGRIEYTRLCLADAAAHVTSK